MPLANTPLAKANHKPRVKELIPLCKNKGTAENGMSFSVCAPALSAKHP